MINATIVTMVGNVAGELRQRRTPEGAKVVSFRMAPNERKYDPSSDRWVNGKHVYANVTCWRQLASGVAASLAKGDPVVVTGRLSTNEYEIDGQQRQSTEVDAIAVGPDLTRCTADIQRHRPDPDAGRTVPRGWVRTPPRTVRWRPVRRSAAMRPMCRVRGRTARSRRRWPGRRGRLDRCGPVGRRLPAIPPARSRRCLRPWRDLLPVGGVQPSSRLGTTTQAG